MRGTCRIVLVAGVLSLGLVLAMPSEGRAQSCWHYSGPVYYYYPPFYCYPAPFVRPARPLAKPDAAPPSTPNPPPQKKELLPAKPPPKDLLQGKPPVENDPPLNKSLQKPPSVVESRSQASHYPLAKERCRVGFWNLTGRDITLKINGQARALAKDRALTVEVERAFVWQIDQQEPASERVPDNQSSHEVILRK